MFADVCELQSFCGFRICFELRFIGCLCLCASSRKVSLYVFFLSSPLPPVYMLLLFRNLEFSIELPAFASPIASLLFFAFLFMSHLVVKTVCSC